jgi:cytochrome c2
MIFFISNFRGWGVFQQNRLLCLTLLPPQKMVPASRMPYDGLPNARDRADLIIYML